MDDSSFFVALLISFVIWFLLNRKDYTSLPSRETQYTHYESQPEQYGVDSHTQMGIPVKSYRERFIADYFTKNNIRYEYEPILMGGYYDNKTIHLDFYLPDHDIYVEYWGLVDALDERLREHYLKKMKWKMAQYHSKNI